MLVTGARSEARGALAGLVAIVALFAAIAFRDDEAGQDATEQRA